MQLAILNPSTLDPTLFQACVTELYRLLVNGKVGKIEKAWFLIVTSLNNRLCSILIIRFRAAATSYRFTRITHFHGDSHQKNSA